MRAWKILAAIVGALLLLASGAGAATKAFTTPVRLTGPAGGEPSIATDPFGDVFVAGPQGIPAGANDEAGTGFWVSRNDGTSFGPGRDLGSFLGGGDDDVLFSKGAVYLTDLEAIASEVCKSTDRGKTFDSIGPVADPDHCSHVGLGQVGPSDDPPVADRRSQGRLYLTYHEFVSAQPLAFRSDNGGNDLFANACGPIVNDPSIEANVPTDITGGTLVARPVTDKAGNFYVLFVTTDPAAERRGAGRRPAERHLQPGLPGRLARPLPVVHRLHRVRRLQARHQHGAVRGHLQQHRDRRRGQSVRGRRRLRRQPAVREHRQRVSVQVDRPTG